MLGYHYAPKYEVRTIRLEDSSVETQTATIAIEGSLTTGKTILKRFEPYKITETYEIVPVFFVIPTEIRDNTAMFEVYFSEVDLYDYEFIKKEQFRGRFRLTNGSTERIKINVFDQTVYS